MSFFSSIFQYFSFLSLASIFCQGSCPKKKQISMQTIPSMSSLLPCSIPKCVLIEAYLAVPVRFLLSLQAIWLPFRVYFLASPKSIMKTVLLYLSLPTKKLSGFTSRCINPWLWMYSIRQSTCRPIIMMVFGGKAFPNCLKRDYNELPKAFITITLSQPSVKYQTQLTLRMPRSFALPSPSRIWSILDQQNNCGFLEVLFYILIASFSFLLLKAAQISPNAPEPSFWPTILYSPYVFMAGNQNKLSSIKNKNHSHLQTDIWHFYSKGFFVELKYTKFAIIIICLGYNLFIEKCSTVSHFTGFFSKKEQEKQLV